MKDVLMITHFTQTPDENGNGRFVYIANMLNQEGIAVEMVTTSFSHRKKTQRAISIEQFENISYKLTTVYEPGYKKNVSPKRFYSHYIMGKNLNVYLQSRKKPDIIYCAVPSLDAAFTATTYANKNHVKLIIDVQDLWPEAFRMVFHVPVLSTLIFTPMVHRANRIYASADAICAVSETYAKRALSVNHKCTEVHSVYLGTRLTDFDTLRQTKPKLTKKQGEIWIGYIGTLGHSYDLTCVMDALSLLRKKGGMFNASFIVMGDGPLRNKFELYAHSLGLSITFTGILPYAEMVPLLCACDIAVNPIKANSAGSIINKVGDYAAAGLPVVNTQECPEYRDLVTDYDIGINCENGNVSVMADAIEALIIDEGIRHRMGKNNRRLAEERFNREVSYKELISVICDTHC